MPDFVLFSTFEIGTVLRCDDPSEVAAMMQREIVTYCRVSTETQGIGGLGMAAQRTAVNAYAERSGFTIVAAYEEVGSGRKEPLDARPELMRAVAHARRSGALLVIARLDRLARNVYVTAQLLESGIEFVCCDNPHANRLTLHILSAMAEYEGRLISERTKAGLAAAKARGVKFGNGGKHFTAEVRRRGQLAAGVAHKRRAKAAYADLVPLIVEKRTAGMSLNCIADMLNGMGHRTQRRHPWSIACVRRLLVREEHRELLPPFFATKTHITPEAIRKRSEAAAAVRRARTKAAYADFTPDVVEMYAAGISLYAISKELNARGHRTQRWGAWNANNVGNLLRRENVTIRNLARTITPAIQRLGSAAGTAFRVAKSKAAKDRVLPLALRLRGAGLTYRAIARELNRRGKRTPRGKRWTNSLAWILLNRNSAARR